MNYKNAILIAAILTVAVLVAPVMAAHDYHVNKYNPNVGSLMSSAQWESLYESLTGTLVVPLRPRHIS